MTSKRRRAIAIIEFAIALPLLLWLILGVVEYGWMILKSQQITNAARQGARVGARVDSGNAEVTAAVDTMMEAAGMSGLGTLTLTPENIGDMPGGAQLEVKLEVTYSAISLGLPLIPTPEKLVTRVTMAKEGYK